MHQKTHHHKKWKTKEWRQKRHALSVLHKHHPKPFKPQKVEPKKKAEGPAWFAKRITSNQLQRQHNNPEKLQEIKIDVIKQALKKKISRFLLTDQESPLNIERIKDSKYESNGRIEMPGNFSVTENPQESYETLQKIISALLLERYDTLVLDYKGCHNVELGTQVLQDI